MPFTWDGACPPPCALHAEGHPCALPSSGAVSAEAVHRNPSAGCGDSCGGLLRTTVAAVAQRQPAAVARGHGPLCLYPPVPQLLARADCSVGCALQQDASVRTPHSSTC
jgi:hypothetical protein